MTILSRLSGGRKRRELTRHAHWSPNLMYCCSMKRDANHLDVDSIEWLERFLLDWQGLTLLFVTHDRAFVNKLIDAHH